MDVNQRRSLKIKEVIGKLELSEKNEELESVNNKWNCFNKEQTFENYRRASNGNVLKYKNYDGYCQNSWKRLCQ